jgi:hypothetical protein
MSGSEPMILPNLLVIGAARDGTTSLFHWFESHPDVCGSSKKETNFLEDARNSKNVDANYHDHGLAAYARLFQHCRGERVRIDATPSYYHSRTALDVLTSMEPRPWVILSLRDPVDQLFSFYRFDVFTRKKAAPETTFADYLDSDRGRQFIAHARYADYIEPWRALNDQFKVLIFEEWTRSPDETIRELFEWIGLAALPEGNYDIRNRSRETRSRWFHLMALRMRGWIPSAVQPVLTSVTVE